jgi:hypothetical protein
MKAGVTKERFIEKYSELLFMTREGVSHLELQDAETVVIHYKDGAEKTVNIACDSALAIIKDVASQV